MQLEQKKARIEQAITNREMRSSKTTKDNDGVIFEQDTNEDDYMFSCQDSATTDMKKAGIYTFRAHGQMYHDIQSFGNSCSDPKHLELYFYDDDPSLEHQYRCCREEKYKQDKHFRSLGQNEKLDDYRLILNLDQRLDQKPYNAPITLEVAVVWIKGNERRNTFDKNVILHGNNNEIQGIKSYYGCYDPLSYPLFFPRAELELRNDNVDRNNSDNDPDSSSKLWVTMREYYCYKFHARPSIFNPILHGGRLFQQFAVDSYIKIESSRLDFIWHHQKEIRADLYKGLLDSIQEGEQKGDKVGKRTVLASSFIGGPRDKLRRYLDAMALNRASCKHNYPRPFNETTIQGKDSYPWYRRRNDGRTETVRNCKLDNRWVVPYNPYLLHFFNCHINVDVCSSIRAVKYLFKYIYKGHDRASVSVTGADDEGEIDEIR
uniref:Helitron helicase-like domain-containing protein n=1 Tax=Setaria italica TaxID=4555 RepID=K3ZD88_SETIT